MTRRIRTAISLALRPLTLRSLTTGYLPMRPSAHARMAPCWRYAVSFGKRGLPARTPPRTVGIHDDGGGVVVSVSRQGSFHYACCSSRYIACVLYITTQACAVEHRVHTVAA